MAGNGSQQSRRAWSYRTASRFTTGHSTSPRSSASCATMASKGDSIPCRNPPWSVAICRQTDTTAGDISPSVPTASSHVPIGAPCNVCDQKGYAQITRMNADGSGREVFATGIRSTVGFTWHPVTKELWFTDNGRDWLGEDVAAR